ncbi:unnamed protein product [Acanthoscelides obtectus]|uniref:Uncharacterized protein n=1 Tax=Acanthoscelides obtectus TaxID=200917 RepID=A0A9P0PM95_ACAOB|nr:unnamed protein product [Acanthoscelides obtectus]CAK1671104.1 hypothetical protein AOBTE_LOCUS28059 [Acanthoscelides obtectus]
MCSCGYKNPLCQIFGKIVTRLKMSRNPIVRRKKRGYCCIPKSMIYCLNGFNKSMLIIFQ